MLPFRQFATVTGASDVSLGTIKLSTWQATEPRETATGEVWDWTGQAEIEAALLLCGQEGNRRLYVVDAESELPEEEAEGTPPGRRFAVLAAVRNDFLPHVELRLRETRGSGN